MLREIYFLSIFEAMDDRLHERQLFVRILWLLGSY